jgi:hypothetical protein
LPVDAYKGYRDPAKSINQLVKSWKEKQLELEREGMGEKEIECLAFEKRRVKDLDKLKLEGRLSRLKEKYKSLTVEKFLRNPIICLGKVSANASANWEDFDRAVASLKSHH